MLVELLLQYSVLKLLPFLISVSVLRPRAFNVYLFHPAAASLGDAFKDFPHLPLILNDIPEYVQKALLQCLVISGVPL